MARVWREIRRGKICRHTYRDRVDLPCLRARDDLRSLIVNSRYFLFMYQRKVSKGNAKRREVKS